jgi:hypothetical protein
MTLTISGWGTSISEVDTIAGQGEYVKYTQGDSVMESLVLGNTSYCKDSSGKWLVDVEDLQAERTQTIATMQAERDDSGGFPEAEGTPVPDATFVPYEYDDSEDLAGYGYVDIEMYDFSYAGEDIVEGVTTRHYTGIEDRLRGLQLPDANAVPEVGDKGEPHVLSLWIDDAAGYVRRVEYKLHFKPMGDTVFGYMEYGCGEELPAGATPTMPPLPVEGTWTSITVLSRLNDRTLTLPQP